MGCLGHQVDGHTEAAISAELHEHACVEHRHSRGGRGVTVGRPCVEREERAKHAESDEDEREEYLLYVNGNIVHGSNLLDVHCRCTAEIVDSEDSDDKQGRASHKHQSELHGSILLVSATPHTDEKIHRDESNLIEHEHSEHIGADEEAVNTGREQCEPKEVLLCHRLELP